MRLDEDISRAAYEFACIQTVTLRHLDEVCRSAKNSLLSRVHIRNVCDLLIRFFVLYLAFFYLLPELWRYTPDSVDLFGYEIALTSTSRSVVAAMIAVAWAIVLTGTAALPSRWLPEKHLTSILLFTVLVCMWLVLTVYVLDFLVGTIVVEQISWAKFFGLFLQLLLNVLLILFLGCVLIFSTVYSLPTLVVLLISDRLLTEPFTSRMSRDLILAQTKNKSLTSTTNWTEDITHQVKTSCLRKASNVSSQAQTFSLAVGALSLLGLLALLVSPQQVQGLLSNAEQLLAEVSSPSEGSLATTASVVLFGLVSACFLYFVNVFRTLRILEVIDALCEEKLRRSTHVPPLS